MKMFKFGNTYHKLRFIETFFKSFRRPKVQKTKHKERKKKKKTQ